MSQVDERKTIAAGLFLAPIRIYTRTRNVRILSIAAVRNHK